MNVKYYTNNIIILCKTIITNYYCKSYSTRPTTAHILNGCTIALEQGRYKWRHDCVLLTLLKGLKSMLEPDVKLYGDVAGYRACVNPQATIPPNLICTTARPDIVIINSDKVIMLELTVPNNTSESLHQARSRKMGKENYQMLQSDLEDMGLSTNFVTVEIGAYWSFMFSDDKVIESDAYWSSKRHHFLPRKLN